MDKPIDDVTLFVNKAVFELIRLRESFKKTQDEVFDETKIHIGRIESEKRDIRLSTLYRLCEYYKITPSDFFKNVAARK